MTEGLEDPIGALALIERINSLSEARRTELDVALSPVEGGGAAARLPVTIGILTALEIEALAVERALLIETPGITITKIRYASAPHAPVSIRVFEFTRQQVTFRVALTQAIKMGNNSASIAATSLIYEFPEIEDILMVGIAGGIPSPLDGTACDRKLIEDHVRLGDIFVADAPIFQYDFLKAEVDKIVNRDIPNSISPRIKKTLQMLRLNELENQRPWEAYLNALIASLGSRWRRPAVSTDLPRRYRIDARNRVVDLGEIVHPRSQPGRRSGKPLVHYGKIGSANTLLKDPKLRDQLRTNFGIRAVEMEGSGVSDAAWNFSIGYGVVRGVCDYCDPHKSDTWQKYSAAVAAAFCRVIVDDAFEEDYLRITQAGR